MRKKVLMDTLKSHFSTSCPASSADVIVLMGQGDIKENPQCTTRLPDFVIVSPKNLRQRV